MTRHLSIAAVLSVAFVFGCARSSTDQSTPPATDATAAETADPVAAQVDRGAALYGANCAGCHGASGQGDKAPAVVGQGALAVLPPEGARHRTMEFHTVDDVFGFVRAAMPPGNTDALTDQEIWAILAFDLKANGIDLEAPLDAGTAADLRLDGGNPP